MDDIEIIKVFGGPGTGKTTTMVTNDSIDDHEGIFERKLRERDPSDLLFMSYTRSAAEEAKRRLSRTTTHTRSSLDDRVTTIHSLVMRMTNTRSSQIIEIDDQPHRLEFCRQQDLEFDRSSGDQIMNPSDDGHQFFQIVGWLKSSRITPNRWTECPISDRWDDDLSFQSLWANWELFKQRRDMKEFDDVILEAIQDDRRIDVSELFVDEVQDLYPLQQQFLRDQSTVIDRLWLAGDDDQTIYEWAGADPSFFLETESQIDSLDESYWRDKRGYWDDSGTYILDQSFRMPENIMRLSQQCIEQIDDRKKKSFDSRDSRGVIQYVKRGMMSLVLNYIDHDHTFCLLRSNQMCQDFGERLIERGIPFEDRFNTWNDRVVEMRDAIDRIYQRDHLSRRQSSRIMNESDLSFDHEPQEIEAESFIEGFYHPRSEEDPTVDLISSLEDFNHYQKRAIEKNIYSGQSSLTPEGLVIETMHWSKGRETKTVIVGLDTIESLKKKEIPDPERRLLYVAMTRAKRRLVLVEEMTDNAETLTGDDLFQDGWRDLVS